MFFYVYNSIGYLSRGANLMFFIEYCYVTLVCLMIIVVGSVSSKVLFQMLLLFDILYR